jgi:aryl-alcohol dehydrogenase-like predicted oxidoreductase/predicted dehydrogenase
MADIIRWGLLGGGNIAKKLGKALLNSTTGKLVSVATRTKPNDEWPSKPRIYSYEELLRDPEVDAVYVATLHPTHAEWAIAAMRAGKHVLCEKPITLNQPDTMSVIRAAKETGMFLMEAFMYRCHPQTRRIVEIVSSGVLGQIKLIEASFSFNAKFSPDSRLYHPDHGGGGILDVGGYPMSMARLVAGAALGKPFAEPVDVKGQGRLAPSGVDEVATALVRFDGNILAQLSTGVGLNQRNDVTIYGSEGSLRVPSPWTLLQDGGKSELELSKGGKLEKIEIDAPLGLYVYEVDEVARAIHAGEKESPFMSHADTLGNMNALDRWRRSFDFLYPVEKTPPRGTPSTRPLPRPNKESAARSKRPAMTYTDVPGIDFKLSRLILGCDHLGWWPTTQVLLDAYFELGGNAFDTAFVYGSGKSEEMLGTWVENRGVRKEVAILSKGAHTPQCDPENLRKQFKISLERLRTDYVDFYVMHRDNPDIPVGEFVDVLNELTRAGQIRTFGGSNWTLPRLSEANQYAKQKGLVGFRVLSNQLSLARMVEPPWGGCLSAHDTASREYLARENMVLLPWSSQARGFFTERAAPDRKDDAELVKCWYADDNFGRKARAEELAKKLGVLPVEVALAWVLHQPFRTLPLIGPRTLSELDSSLGALAIQLSPEQVRWLDVG